MKLSKLVCWHLWIEHNQRIFHNIDQPPEKIVIKTQALMGEVLKTNQISRNKAKLTVNEIMWLHSFNFVDSDFEPLSKKLETWEIRFDNSQFGNWMKERKMFKLFFDDASKGNPRKAGGGGVIICPEGNIEVEYYWNIGFDSNNMAEVYGLWQGIKQLKEKRSGGSYCFW